MSRSGQIILGWMAGAIAAALGILWIATRIATWMACGESPVRAGLLDGLGAVSGRPPATATGCTAGLAGIVFVVGALFVILIAAAIVGWWGWVRWRESDRKLIRDLKGRIGFAQHAEIQKTLSTKAIQKRGPSLRPSLAAEGTLQATDVAWKAGRSRALDILVSIEESVVLLGPPRSGKGYMILINAILDWPGPLVTTSTTTDNLRATRAHRERVGRVFVFDPQKLSGEAHPVRISPITGCEDPLTATQRAAVLVAGAGMGGSNNQEWAEQAKAQLASLLCAAALDGRTVGDLARWGSSPALAVEAADILSSNPGAPRGWGAALATVLDSDPRLLGNIWFGVTGAVAPLRIPEIAEAMTPQPGEVLFDPHAFLAGQNTLYLIGTKSGAGAVGGYLAALLDDIVEIARRKALASKGSRIDPPLGLILDEIANMFVWPQLPNIMSDGGGRGICPIVVLQSRKQAEVVWSAAEMHAVFGAATAKILLGGSSDNDYLTEIQALLGPRAVKRTSRSFSEQGTNTSEQVDKEPLVAIDELRRFPARLGLLIAKNIRPVLLDLTAWTGRADASTVIDGQKRTEAAQREVFATQEQERRARTLP